jgi:esterase/lipase
MASTAEDWMGAAERQLDELEGKYQGISLMGHSMGGAIAVVATRHRNIEKMVLYAPALALPTIPVRTIRFLSHFIKRKGRPWARDPAMCSSMNAIRMTTSSSDASIGRTSIRPSAGIVTDQGARSGSFA